MPSSDLPHTFTATPIRAYKAAYPWVDFDPTAPKRRPPVWSAWGCGSPYRTVDKARCACHPLDRHHCPTLNSVCGFHALPTRAEAMDLIYSGSCCLADRPVHLLTVDLWGRVIRHRRGYRAQYQRVVEAEPIPHDQWQIGNRELWSRAGGSACG